MNKEITAPERIWVQVYPGHRLIATDSDPREAHDNGKPVHVYVLADDEEEITRAEEIRQLERMFDDV